MPASVVGVPCVMPVDKVNSNFIAPAVLPVLLESTEMCSVLQTELVTAINIVLSVNFPYLVCVIIYMYILYTVCVFVFR